MTQITYPIKFAPLLQENIWGGDYLKQRSNTIPVGPVGESWEISDYRNETTLVANGKHKGKTLHEIIEMIYGSHQDSNIPERFPLLLKILAPESELSVQVHPNDSYTKMNSIDESGKAEAWYVLDAPEDSFLYLGLTGKLDKQTIKKAIEDGTLVHYLNKVYVKAGDVVNIPHGTIHSLCPHIKVFEIQQSSNITYRLYDWGRTDSAGNSRALHINEALEVINFDYLPDTHLISGQTLTADGYYHQRYIESANFTMEKVSKLAKPVTLKTNGEKVMIISSLNSSLQVKARDGNVTLGKYDSCLIPAATDEFTINGDYNADFLIYY